MHSDKFLYPLTFNDYNEKDAKAVYDLFLKGKLTQGEVTLEYEKKLAEYFGTKYAVAVNSGSSANLLMIAALLYSPEFDLNIGDEILVPAVSWLTTYSPIVQLGLQPIIVDINPDTLNIDLNKIKKSITKNTKAILTVNLLGNPSGLRSLKNLCDDHALILLEDNCESMGAKYTDKYAGTWGIMGTQSTYFSHHITTIEGGHILTDDEHAYEMLISLRSHGWARDISENSKLRSLTSDISGRIPDYFLFLFPGFNLRTTEINSLLGIRQLPKLKEYIGIRRTTFNSLLKASANFKTHLSTIETEEAANSSYFGFSMVCKESNKIEILEENLNLNGFQTRPIVSGNILRHPISRFIQNSKSIECPVADSIHDNGIMISSFLKNPEQACSSLQRALEHTFQPN